MEVITKQYEDKIPKCLEIKQHISKEETTKKLEKNISNHES